MAAKRELTDEQKARLAPLQSIELPDPDDPNAEKKWKALGRALLPVFRDAAAGAIDLEATQRQMLQNIMDRAFGKVGQKKDADLNAAGVVILPTQGEAAKTKVCEQCQAFHLGNHL